jgi:cytochrome c oxidase cbb3-type subunit 4
MDPGFVRGVGTLVLLLAFVGLCVWAWSPRQLARFQEAAQLPLRDDEDLPGGTARGGGDDE